MRRGSCSTSSATSAETATTVCEGPITLRGGPGSEFAAFQDAPHEHRFQQRAFAREFDTLRQRASALRTSGRAAHWGSDTLEQPGY